MLVRSREEAAVVLRAYHDLLEKAALEGEARFQEAFESPPLGAGVHEIDEQHVIVRVSSGELALLGYTREQMVGRHAWDFIVMQEASQRAIDQKLRETKELNPFVRSFKRADGTAITLLLLDRRLRDAQGKVVGLRTTMAVVARSTVADQIQ